MRFFASALCAVIAAEHDGNQRDLVRHTGINQGTVSKYARGQELPSGPNLRRLLTKYPAHRADLAAAIANDILESAGASDLRVTLNGKPPKRPDAETEKLIARVSDRLRRDPQFRKIVAQLDAL